MILKLVRFYIRACAFKFNHRLTINVRNDETI